jgi:simple sugar transport system substrate-binding protein
MKRLGTLAAALFAAAALTAAPAAFGAGKPRFVVVTHGQASDPFWSVVKKGVDEAQKDTGATVEYVAPDTFDMVRMAQMIDAAVASKPDGLVVSMPDADALGKSVRNAVGAGIPVITINSGSDVYKKLGALVHVGQTELEAGMGAGQRMAALGIKSAVCVNQEVGNVALDLRCEGFAKGLGGKTEVVGVSMDPTEIRTGVVGYLTKHPEAKGILTLGPSAAGPVLAALEQQGKTKDYTLATFDLSPEVLKALAAGKMAFAIDQQQYLQGYLPIIFLNEYVKYGAIPSSIIQTGPGFVTPDNAQRVIQLSSEGYR